MSESAEDKLLSLVAYVRSMESLGTVRAVAAPLENDIDRLSYEVSRLQRANNWLTGENGRLRNALQEVNRSVTGSLAPPEDEDDAIIAAAIQLGILPP